MTGDLYLDLAISVAGIALMVGVSWMIGAWRSRPVERAAAAERLAFDEPDFAAVDWMVSEDRRAAAAISERGDEAALVFSVGDRLATRRFALGDVRARCEDSKIIIETGDLSKPKIVLAAQDARQAAEWAGRLAG